MFVHVITGVHCASSYLSILHRLLFQAYLNRQPGRSRQAFVITVGESSYGILKSADDHYQLFDSHGHYRKYRNERLFKRASVFHLGSLLELVGFVVAKHGSKVCAIAALDVTRIIQVVPTKPTKIVQKQIREDTKTKQAKRISNRFGFVDVRYVYCNECTDTKI